MEGSLNPVVLSSLSAAEYDNNKSHPSDDHGGKEQVKLGLSIGSPPKWQAELMSTLNGRLLSDQDSPLSRPTNTPRYYRVRYTELRGHRLFLCNPAFCASLVKREEISLSACWLVWHYRSLLRKTLEVFPAFRLVVSLVHIYVYVVFSKCNTPTSIYSSLVPFPLLMDMLVGWLVGGLLGWI